MAAMGWCPSGRLFEAAACGAPILSDCWDGLDEFFAPGRRSWSRATPRTRSRRSICRDAELARDRRARRASATLAEHTADAPRGGADGRGARGRDPCAARRHEHVGHHSGRRARQPIQPLAFSKELLPVGSRLDGGVERPRAVSEYLVERMIFGRRRQDLLRDLARQVATSWSITARDRRRRHRLCGAAEAGRAVRCDLPRAAADRPTTSRCWSACPTRSGSPRTRSRHLPDDRLSFLLFPVERPELFDAVVTRRRRDACEEIQVKQRGRRDRNWIWGAFKMPGARLHELHALWLERERRDEYIGTLVNAYSRRAAALRRARAASLCRRRHAARLSRGDAPAGRPCCRRRRDRAAACERRRPTKLDASTASARSSHGRARNPRRGAGAWPVVSQPRPRRHADRARALPGRLPGGEMAAVLPRHARRTSRAGRCSTSAAMPASTRSR